jgi:hypothetical protein
MFWTITEINFTGVVVALVRGIKRAGNWSTTWVQDTGSIWTTGQSFSTLWRNTEFWCFLTGAVITFNGTFWWTDGNGWALIFVLSAWAIWASNLSVLADFSSCADLWALFFSGLALTSQATNFVTFTSGHLWAQRFSGSTWAIGAVVCSRFQALGFRGFLALLNRSSTRWVWAHDWHLKWTGDQGWAFSLVLSTFTMSTHVWLGWWASDWFLALTQRSNTGSISTHRWHGWWAHWSGWAI